MKTVLGNRLLSLLLAGLMLFSCIGCMEQKPVTDAPSVPGETQMPSAEQSLPAEEGSLVNNGFDETQIVLQFAAISDFQHGQNIVDTYGRGKWALKQLKERALEYTDKGLDAVLIAGDLIYNSTAAQAEEFGKMYREVLDPAQVPAIFALGNHDVQVGASYTKEELKMEDYYRIFGDDFRSYETETSNLDIGCTHQIVNGYHFLTINAIDTSYPKIDSGNVVYSQEALDWLDKTLATITAEEPDQYVFIATHPVIYDTVFGSDLITGGTNWYTWDLTPVLEKYPQVVTFGGHLHFTISDERSIMQDKFTSLDCGAIAYMATDPGNYRHMRSATVMKDCTKVSCGYLAQVDIHGNARFIRMNFYLEQDYKEPFVISAPAEDGSHLKAYTKERGNPKNNDAPVLAEDAISVEDNRDSAGDKPLTVRLTFRSGTDDDAIYNYVLTVREGDAEVETIRLLADSYLHATPAEMRESWMINLDRASYFTGHTYTIHMVAYDSWGASSNEVVYEYAP